MFCPYLFGYISINKLARVAKKQNSLLLLFGTAEFTVPQIKMHWKYIYIFTLYIVVQFWFCPPVRESEIKVGCCGIPLFFSKTNLAIVLKAISAGIFAVLICHTSERFQLVVFFIFKFLEEHLETVAKHLIRP